MPFKTTGQAALGANAPKQDPREANCKTRSKHALFETRQGIRELCLDSRGLENFSCLHGMTCLQTLWLARNRLRSLEGLAWASQLRMLFVQSNQLLCLEPSLRQLQSLQVLDVSCNLLQNLDDCLATLKSLRNLSDLMLQDNPCYREDICGQKRFHVVRQLPDLKILNRLFITARERRAASTLPHLPAASQFAFGRSRSRRRLLLPTCAANSMQNTAAALVSDEALVELQKTGRPEAPEIKAASAPSSPAQPGPAPTGMDLNQAATTQAVGTTAVPQPASVQPSRSAPLAYSAWKIPPPAGCKEAIKAAALGRSMDASALKLTQHGRICSDDYVAKDVWKYCGQQNAATDLLGTARARLSMRI
ncbi:hypothetical protein WJX74_010197 [Apatococcus lobatus]|uniref:Leucine-rich repeat-containing protein 72 n=1 Tax=Apatococcus lobatus TaxID=904363 RepID=A0AAW1SHE2_9CHLO